MLVLISTYLNNRDLRSLVATSKSICRLLLQEYLHRRGLVLKNDDIEGPSVELRDLSGYASLGLWSVAQIFHPPKEMYCSIPCDTQEARGAIGFLTRFLLEPSNARSLRDFYLSLHGTDPLLLTSDFVRMRRLFFSLPLTRLSFSGYVPACHLPPSISLRRSGPSSCRSRTLTSFIISSDYAFAPGLMQTTMGILRHSLIKSLTIYMVSLNLSQWSTLLGGLNMASLEDIELEGDIPRPALVHFLFKHEGLKNIRIRCSALSERAQPSRSRHQPFLPNLLTLHAPLAVCCDIAQRLSDSSKLYELKVEMNQFCPFDHSFRHLLEILRYFQKLDYLGLRFVPGLQSTVPQLSPGDRDWDKYPAHELRQIRTLSFFHSHGHLSPGDNVCARLAFLLIFSTSVVQQDTICAYVRSFPLVETVYTGGGDGEEEFGMQLLDSLCKAKRSLRFVAVLSGSHCLKWTADGCSG